MRSAAEKKSCEGPRSKTIRRLTGKLHRFSPTKGSEPFFLVLAYPPPQFRNHLEHSGSNEGVLTVYYGEKFPSLAPPALASAAEDLAAPVSQLAGRSKRLV